MTEVVFVTSNQAQQTERVRSIATRLKQRLPDVAVKTVEAAGQPELLAQYKLKFGPAVIIDGLLEYVGVPRLSMLIDRVIQVREGRANPRTAGEKPGAKAATPKPPIPAPPTPGAT